MTSGSAWGSETLDRGASTTSEPTVYQVPVASERDEPMRINFERTVLEGVQRNQLEDVYDVPLEHETLRVWGNQADESATTGDYLLFGDRDGRSGGEYTLLARVEHAVVLDETPAAAFTEAIGWGDVSDDSYSHVMFLEPLYEATVDRADLWETLGYKGWPNNTYSAINFGRDESTFFTEYDSVETFLEQSCGTRLYPTNSAGETDSAGEYETLEAAITDVRGRLTDSSMDSAWLEGRLGRALVAEWSAALAGFKPSDSVSPETAATFDRLRSVYNSLESDLEEAADELGIGSHYSFSPAKTLFLCWVRILQDDIDEGSVLSQPRLNSILRDSYTVERDREPKPITDPPSTTHPVLTHVRTASPTVYKFTAPCDYWISSVEYGAVSFETEHRNRWEALSEGDVAILHARAEPSSADLESQPGGIIGVGILGQTLEKDDPWWRDEHENGDSYPLIARFDRLFLTGSIDDIDTSRSITEKTTATIDRESAALTENALPIEQANGICESATGKAFPAQSQYATFRADDDTIDHERPIVLVEAIVDDVAEVPTINVHKSSRGTLPAGVLEGLYFPDEQGERILEQITTALHTGKHVLLTGPPGTGKTEIARRVCSHLSDSNPSLYSGYETTTATADWSTFDTVGGYMPTESDESSGDDLAFTPGIVLNRLEDAQTGTQSNELLVIDELNRADIDKAFGQLFTLLSGQSVQLPYTRDGREVEITTTAELSGTPDDHQYLVPESWRIFATMNTYDKTSLYEMSYAFMRRFAFIRIPAPELPESRADEDRLEEIVYEYASAWDLEVGRNEAMAIGRVWREINHAVEERAIGPAIIEDVLRYVNQHPESELEYHLTQAVISYVFPQLEGVPKRRQIVQEIAAVREIDDSLLEQAAREMLQVTVATNE